MELAQKDNMEKSALSKGDIEKHMGKINATHLERKLLDKTFGDDVESLDQKYHDSLKKYHDSLKEIYKKREEYIQNIPKFWVTCLKNHPELEFMLGGKVEMECLNFLEKIEVDVFDCDQNGYQIKFHFMENPFFENKVLVKTVDPHGQTDASDAGSTLIQWKKGKNLANRTQDFERLRNGRKMILPVQDTLFSWLADESTLPNWFAYFLKEHIWLNPVKYFTGKLSDDKDDSIDDEEEEEEEEEDSDDD